jgi:hypothetical protein
MTQSAWRIAFKGQPWVTCWFNPCKEVGKIIIVYQYCPVKGLRKFE